MLLVPGAVVMALLRSRPSNTAGRVVLAVCLSMTVIMVVGGAASLIGPHLGVAHPLNSLPEYVIWFVLALVALAFSAARHRDPITWIFEGVRTKDVVNVLVVSLLLVLSILGAAQLNYSGNDRLAIFATTLDAAVLIAAVVGGWSRTSRWPLSTLLYITSLALLLSTSLRGGHLYGWDIQEEFGVASSTLHAGVWVIPANHDPYASMLSLTVLPALLHSLTRLRLLAFFQLVVPAILALMPLAVFTTVRSVPRWITFGRRVPRPGLALAVAVGLIVSSDAFSGELVSITRQAMALAMLTALIMVLFDRTMLVRPSRIIIGLLLVAISFTHYTTSYFVAIIVLCSWLVGLLWSNGWLGVPRDKISRHRSEVRSRHVINIVLVVVALAAAFGWNLAITRNSALSAPSSAITAKGLGIAASSGTTSLLPPKEFERILVNELQVVDSWISPVPGASRVRLIPATTPSSPGVVRGLSVLWNDLTYLCGESIWLILGIALLYGLFRLGRRKSYQYSADLVGIAVAGLAMGALLRFSGTLAAYYSPERAAIFTSILLAAPVTLFLDDIVSYIYSVDRFSDDRVVRASLGAGVAFLVVSVVWATGLGAVFFGGQPPGSLSRGDVNVEQFTVSTPELASAVWLRDNAGAQDTVQSDVIGHLVLTSEPGTYNLLDEIVPPEVNGDSYIYLSAVNLYNHLSVADADNGNYYTSYRTTTRFFNHHFYVVFSTGSTRVYH
jgi:uncharacterized membrane protein